MSRVSEEDCWFVIGAHQAGASERICSELSGLSKTNTHNIIRNFKKLGSPHASNLTANALINKDEQKKRKKYDKNTPRKRGRPRKPAEPPFFTKSIIQNTLKEARKNQESVYSNKHPIQVYPLDRLNTPPSDEDLPVPEMSELPLTPRSEEEEDGDETWSMKDDKELLMHVFNLPSNRIKWKQTEGLFNDRHLAKMCADRWDFLKKQILKDIIDL